MTRLLRSALADLALARADLEEVRLLVESTRPRPALARRGRHIRRHRWFDPDGGVHETREG